MSPDGFYRKDVMAPEEMLWSEEFVVYRYQTGKAPGRSGDIEYVLWDATGAIVQFFESLHEEGMLQKYPKPRGMSMNTFLRKLRMEKPLARDLLEDLIQYLLDTDALTPEQSTVLHGMQDAFWNKRIIEVSEARKGMKGLLSEYFPQGQPIETEQVVRHFKQLMQRIEEEKSGLTISELGHIIDETRSFLRTLDQERMER